MRAIRYVSAIPAGFVIGALLYVAYQCGSAWYHGGSPDPRCALGWRGYVEVHKLEPKRDSVLCQYRPEVGAP